MAPRSGCVREELIYEAAEYLGRPFNETAGLVDRSADGFPDEWRRTVTDPEDPAQVTRFYNESQFGLFEQIAWHAGEDIHHRSFVCADLVAGRPGRDFLDYGSGIGSNAIVFGLAGFRGTLADIADPLLGFARWRCERRGIAVRTIDLKRQSLERDRYDVISCFDVLEHIPRPLGALGNVSRALRPGGIFFLYAPVGYDPDRPQHVVHDDAFMRRIRSLGFQFRTDCADAFPAYIRPPSVYERVPRSFIANVGYYLRDVWLSGRTGDVIARRWKNVSGAAAQ